MQNAANKIQDILGSPSASRPTHEMDPEEQYLPSMFPNAQPGTPADTENHIHSVANAIMTQLQKIIATIREEKIDETDDKSLSHRVRLLLLITHVLVNIRQLHRPLSAARPVGRPKKSFMP